MIKEYFTHDFSTQAINQDLITNGIVTLVTVNRQFIAQIMKNGNRYDYSIYKPYTYYCNYTEEFEQTGLIDGGVYEKTESTKVIQEVKNYLQQIEQELKCS